MTNPTLLTSSYDAPERILGDWGRGWNLAARLGRLVSEHRGLWMSLAVALITIGLGGYVSLRVAAAVAGHPVQGHGLVLVCCLAAVSGVLVLVALEMVFVHLWWVRKRLAIFTIEGLQLLNQTRELRQGATQDDGALAALISDYNAWHGRVVKWLTLHNADAAVHFENQSGMLLIASLAGTGGAADVEVMLDTRLTRLAEIASWDR